MTLDVCVEGQIGISAAPAVPGLRFRGFRGKEDYLDMLAVINGSKEADGIERSDTVESIARNYRHLTNSDPYRDMLLVEVHGEVIGYSRVWWWDEIDGTRLHGQFAFLLPAWRGRGIRRAMLLHNERRIREVARAEPGSGEHHFDAGAADTELEWASLLFDEGYKAVRYFNEMVRPDLEDIPDLPLPDGLEVRPVPPESYPTVWSAQEEAFRDHWGAARLEDEWYEEWLESDTFVPRLWQVAWDGDKVAGMVLNQIDEKENAEYGRNRGWTEDISVGRPYRRRGLASALIARSLQVLKDEGMTEAALGVDTQNLSGALRLYERLGYRAVKRYTTFRKPLAGG
jgi:ribosomal protein S18 acetylase RimI-like enzyme